MLTSGRQSVRFDYQYVCPVKKQAVISAKVLITPRLRHAEAFRTISAAYRKKVRRPLFWYIDSCVELSRRVYERIAHCVNRMSRTTGIFYVRTFGFRFISQYQRWALLESSRTLSSGRVQNKRLISMIRYTFRIEQLKQRLKG